MFSVCEPYMSFRDCKEERYNKSESNAYNNVVINLLGKKSTI